MNRAELTGVTLCMIVRNEEAFIEACLLSARPYVAEMIVCDTGSTDTTMVLAQSLGAQVVQREWTDDFAAARNYALSLASQPWILVLDADERLEPSAMEVWQKLLLADDQWGYYVRLISDLARTDAERGEDAVTDAVCRLFRNDERVRFTGVIHEECASAVAALQGGPLAIAPLTIRHEGYRIDIVEQRRKVERNSRLLTKALAHNPDDPLLRYAAGTELLGAGLWLEAAAWLQPLIGQLDDTCGFASDVYLKLSHAYRMAGYLDEAASAAEAGLQEYIDFPDLYEALAAVHMARDDAQSALQALKQAIAIGAAAPYYSSVEGAGGYRTMCAAGAACEQLYEWRGAAVYYEAALREHPGLERAWTRLLALSIVAVGEDECVITALWQGAVNRLLMMSNEEERAGGRRRTLERERLRVAQLLLRLHDPLLVGPYVERLVQNTGGRGMKLLGWLALQQGDFVEVERCWTLVEQEELLDGVWTSLRSVLHSYTSDVSNEAEVSDEALLLAGDWAGWLERATGAGGAGMLLPHVLQFGALLRGVERLVDEVRARAGLPCLDLGSSAGSDAGAGKGLAANYAWQASLSSLKIAGPAFGAELAAGLLAAAADRWHEACDCFAAARSASAHPVQGRAAASALAAAFAARADEALAGSEYGGMLPQSSRSSSELRLIALTALYPP